ncbi:hypothetical protein Bca52824_000491 [Brassica carinata]|uniref:WEB family protein n=1 Tax=Brassica carinata TaxID=52824 RepID=A0A8X7WFP8_BRACI|nr:hypothetical protein Bca52824_000491 [Brassica carinata]
MAEPLCESSFVGDIDTSAPFESVREAATRFGGFGFWKPSSLSNIFEPSQNDVDEANIVASELEKELISKEGEALKVLKSLESIKGIVEELKSKLHRREDKENCDMSVLKELNQAKTNLCKTTEDLAAIRESVELLNKRLEEERAALEKTREEARFAVDKAVCEIERTRSKIKAAELRLVAARKMKEAARAAEAVAIAEIKDVTRRRRRRETLQEEILEKIEETAQEIRSSKRTIEEGLERVNSAKMEEEETKWQWSERRRRSSSYKGKYKNRRETVLMDVNGLDMMMNGDGTSSSVAVLKPAMSIGQILSRKLLLADEAAMMMNGRVSLGQILGKTNVKERSGEGKEKEKRVNGKRKRFGLAKLSVMLNKECKNKKKKIVLNLK